MSIPVYFVAYLHSLPIHLLISGYLLQTPNNSNFFRFPSPRFELSGVDCSSMMGYSELSPGKLVCCYVFPWLAWDLRGNHWLFRIQLLVLLANVAFCNLVMNFRIHSWPVRRSTQREYSSKPLIHSIVRKYFSI